MLGYNRVYAQERRLNSVNFIGRVLQQITGSQHVREGTTVGTTQRYASPTGVHSPGF